MDFYVADYKWFAGSSDTEAWLGRFGNKLAYGLQDSPAQVRVLRLPFGCWMR
jgi:hypothetical protein